MKKLLVALLLLSLLVLPALFTSCAGKGFEENDMNLATSNIPLIDTTVPAKIETATFSLG
jgi:hypothetical protein